MILTRTRQAINIIASTGRFSIASSEGGGPGGGPEPPTGAARLCCNTLCLYAGETQHGGAVAAIVHAEVLFSK